MKGFKIKENTLEPLVQMMEDVPRLGIPFLKIREDATEKRSEACLFVIRRMKFTSGGICGSFIHSALFGWCTRHLVE